MTQWLIIAILYALVLLSFRLLGGFGAAAEAFRTWGERTSAAARD
jgi:hypothetical protein